VSTPTTARPITIAASWREYFLNPDEGLGTTYERFILHRYFKLLKSRYGIQTVLEAPSFGMTGISGINSVWWASEGVKVTVVDQCIERLQAVQKIWKATGLEPSLVFQSPTAALLPFADCAFDMAWNFAALWHVQDGETYLKELARVAKTALFFCVPNSRNICWVVRPHNAAEYELDNIKTEWIVSCVASCGWHLVDTGFFDVPPWPDIAMKKEQVLKRMGLNWLAKSMERKQGGGICILDHFRGRSPEMERRILRYSVLEKSPGWVKKLWAHHRFLLFERA
jgi:SAM-dependent methyltransferase